MKSAEDTEKSLESIIAPLSARQLLAQLLMIDFPGTELDSFFTKEHALHPWGGVVLFARNMEHEDQLRGLTAQLQGISQSVLPGFPLLIAADHEGGIVSRFSFPSTVSLCGNMALAATGNVEFPHEAARICADDLITLGINTNFAPVVDVNNNAMNPIIGARSFGESPELVSQFGRAYIRGLQGAGIISVAKHFPGHGDTSFDSHRLLPVIPHQRERLMKVELVPFKGAIEEGVGMIMTAHITFPALEPETGLPATLSGKILKDLLRSELRYEGVIITDSISMKAITDNYGYEEAAIKAYEAGADAVLLCGTEKQQLSALDALEEAVNLGRLGRVELERSLKRLLLLRKSVAGRKTAEGSHDENMALMRTITRASITLVRNNNNLLPAHKTGRTVLVMPDLFPLSPLGEAKIPPSLDRHMKNRFPRLEVFTYGIKTGEMVGEDMPEKISKADLVIFASFCTGKLPSTQREKIMEILGINRNLVVASLNSPYILMEIPEVPAYINCYNYGDLSTEALSEVIAGEYAPAGRLPVSLPGLYPAGHFLTYG